MSNHKQWFPLWVGDYLADTMHLSCQEHGAYLLLLMNYWRRGGPLPDDDRYLSNTVSVTVTEWSAMRSPLSEFFDVRDGMWISKRMEEEISRAKSNYESKKRSAEATNVKKKTRVTVTDAVTDAVSVTVTDAVRDSVTGVQSQSQSHSTDREREKHDAPPAVPKTRTPTLKDVLAFAEMHSVKREHAESFFNHYESQGWINGAGLAIMVWTNKLMEWASRNNQLTPVRANSAPANGKAKSVFELKTVMEAKIAMAAEIKNRHCSEHGLGDTWGNKEKQAEYRKLKTEIKELQKQIGAAA